MCSYQQQRSLFEAHTRAYGRLDYAILNAGINELGIVYPTIYNQGPLGGHCMTFRPDLSARTLGRAKALCPGCV